MKKKDRMRLKKAIMNADNEALQAAIRVHGKVEVTKVYSKMSVLQLNVMRLNHSIKQGELAGASTSV